MSERTYRETCATCGGRGDVAGDTSVGAPRERPRPGRWELRDATLYRDGVAVAEITTRLPWLGDLADAESRLDDAVAVLRDALERS